MRLMPLPPYEILESLPPTPPCAYIPLNASLEARACSSLSMRAHCAAVSSSYAGLRSPPAAVPESSRVPETSSAGCPGASSEGWVTDTCSLVSAMAVRLLREVLRNTLLTSTGASSLPGRTDSGLSSTLSGASAIIWTPCSGATPARSRVPVRNRPATRAARANAGTAHFHQTAADADESRRSDTARHTRRGAFSSASCRTDFICRSNSCQLSCIFIYLFLSFNRSETLACSIARALRSCEREVVTDMPRASAIS